MKKKFTYLLIILVLFGMNGCMGGRYIGELPELPSLRALPTLPSLSALPELPSLGELSALPELESLPELPA